MKRTLLLTALMLCLGHAAAAEPTPAEDAAKARGAATQAERDADTMRADAARAESARAELAELRAQMRELSGKMARLSTELGDVGPRAYAFRYLGDRDRAVIGVVLSPEPKGARISAVTPDSPAARAGLRDGDLVTAINGKRFANPQDPKDGLREARDLLGDLKDGQEVRIAYERGAKAQPELKLKAARREAYNWPQVIVGEPGNVAHLEELDKTTRMQVERALESARSIDPDRIRADVDRAMRGAQSSIRRAMPWWGLSLVPLNPDLGRYFGTDHGALVLSADSDSSSGLRGGDVITEVAGEKVADPSDAMRALRDQAADKEVPFKVLRERKTITLNVKAPEYKSIFNAMPLPPLPPEPPTPPPAATAPPAPSAPPAET